MAVSKLDYSQFNSEYSAINTCIENIEEELNTANTKLNDATSEGSGKWASTDIDDWNKIYKDINAKFDRLQALMQAAGVSAESIQSTESTYSGFSSQG